MKSRKSDNLWLGGDYAKTEYAMRYAKQLQQRATGSGWSSISLRPVGKGEGYIRHQQVTGLPIQLRDRVAQ